MALAPLLASMLFCLTLLFQSGGPQSDLTVFLVSLPFTSAWCLFVWHFGGTSFSFVGDWNTGIITLKTYDVAFINVYREDLDVTEVKAIKTRWEPSSGSRGGSLSGLALIKESGEVIELLPCTSADRSEKEAIVDMARQYLNLKYERNLR